MKLPRLRQALAEFDCIFAKAGFALAYNACVPRFSQNGRRLLLREARHPLLETVLRKQRKPITPISYELTEPDPVSADQRPEYRRQNRHDEDDRLVSSDGARRYSCPVYRSRVPTAR